MKAVLSRAVGGPETLTFEDIADPAPAKGEVVVRVAACGVNYPDALIIEDRYQFKPERPFSPGGEVAGVVEGVGEGVKHVKAGDRVLAFCGWGGFAEKVRVDSRRCMPIPDAMPFEDAAALLMTYGTSWYALKDRGHLQPGQTLFVLGAAGGVGTAAIQLARRAGAVVTAVTRDARHHEELRDLGASYLTTTANYCVHAPADVVLELVGAAHLELVVNHLAPRARVVVIGVGGGGAQLSLNLLSLMSTRATITGSTLRARSIDEKAELARALQRDVIDGVGTGAFRVPLAAEFDLADASSAYEAFAHSGKFGKIVLTLK